MSFTSAEFKSKGTKAIASSCGVQCSGDGATIPREAMGSADDRK